jgi:sec-independent protein translocase protein TatA
MGSGLLQPTHVIVLLVVALLVLGPKRLPEVGKSLGEGLKSFKSSLDGHDDEPQPRRATVEQAAAPAEATAATTRADD